MRMVIITILSAITVLFIWIPINASISAIMSAELTDRYLNRIIFLFILHYFHPPSLNIYIAKPEMQINLY